MKVTIEVELDDPSTERVKEILGAVRGGQTTVGDWKDNDDQTDTSEQESTDDRSDGADDDADTDDELDATLRPDTWKFKAASTLYHHADDRLSASDVADPLHGTEWKHDNPQNVSRDLKYLVDDGIAEREKVEQDHGHDHFVFWLTDAGERLVEDTEDDPDVRTYRDVAESGLGALFNGTETAENGGEA